MDQASRLRELINAKTSIRKKPSNLPSKTTKGPRVICVTSGKGGVGKTNFTTNLAIALSRQDQRVVIVDADLGLANVDVVLGMITKYNLLDIVNQRKSISEVMHTGPAGIKIISGGSGLVDLLDIPIEGLNRIVSKFDEINDHADIILIDTGAGLSKAVMSFVLAVEEIVIVTTSEPTSITDAYAMIKNIVLQDKNKDIKIIVNRVENLLEGKIAFEKLKKASEKFLNKEIHKLGTMPEDINVSKAVKCQQPFIIKYPNSAISRNIEIIALKLTDHFDEKKVNKNPVSFAHKVITLFR